MHSPMTEVVQDLGLLQEKLETLRTIVACILPHNGETQLSRILDGENTNTFTNSAAAGRKKPPILRAGKPGLHLHRT